MRSGDVDQSRLRRVIDLLIRESGVHSEWFQVFGMGFIDDTHLSQVGQGQSRRFPTWQQRTGSAVLDVSDGVNRAEFRQSPPVKKTPLSHREPPPTTTSGLLPPRWKALRMVRNNPLEHSFDELRHRQYTPRP